MPEIPIAKDNYSLPREDDVGLARQAFNAYAISKTSSPKRAPK
jgi:hypothetical protein